MSTFSLTAHEHVTVTHSSPELLAMEVTWTSGGTLPPPHLHPSQDEHFEVHSGSLRAVVGGVERLISAGESFDVPRGVVHQMTAAPGGARATWEVRPALRTESFFRAMAAANGNKLTQLAVVADHPEEFRPTGGLRTIVRVLGALRPRS